MSVNDSIFESQEVQLLKNELLGLNDVYRDIADEIGRMLLAVFVYAVVFSSSSLIDFLN